MEKLEELECWKSWKRWKSWKVEEWKVESGRVERCIMDTVHIWIKCYNVDCCDLKSVFNVVDEYYGKNIAKRLRAC